MRFLSLALATAALLAAATPALALDVVELKNGKVLEIEKAHVSGGKLYVRLHAKEGQLIETMIPVSKVVPEFVYYIWAGQIKKTSVKEHLALAEWARGVGLFSHALRSYEAAAEVSAEVKNDLPQIKDEMREEAATWYFTEAEKYFRQGDVKAARMLAEVVLKKHADSKEVGRTKALLSIIKEREQFLSEEKRREEVARRARKQKRLIDHHLKRIALADHHVRYARMYNPGDAKRRLRYAAYAYRRASFDFQEMLLFAEVDSVRATLENLIETMDSRMVRTFGKLADLRYITGDPAGALDAAHEILAIDPDNEQALNVRERVLDYASTPSVPAGTYYGVGWGYRCARSRRGFIRYDYPGMGIVTIRRVPYSVYGR